jgi:hypothetical protein
VVPTSILTENPGITKNKVLVSILEYHKQQVGFSNELVEETVITITKPYDRQWIHI